MRPFRYVANSKRFFRRRDVRHSNARLSKAAWRGVVVLVKNTEKQQFSPREGSAANANWPWAPMAEMMEYAVDAAQRTVLFFDVMRQRGDQYREHLLETVPHVLDYEVELVVDGRTLDRPVNYALARIRPPQGVTIDPARRPFVIVDPRAGHGPGIGGFKADSEIGVALKAGHPCYFIGFLPEPMPGQTIQDIARAEAVFLEKVIG